MPLRTLGTSRLYRRCLLALPLALGAGCLSSGSATSQPPASNAPPANPTLYRPQKIDDVRPAAATSLPPTTLADGKVAVRAVAYVNNSPIFETELRDAVMQHIRELSKLNEPERSEKLAALRNEELERLIEREAIMEEATTRIKKMKPKLLEELQHEATLEFEKRLRDMKAQVGSKTDEEFNDFLTSQGMSTESLKRQLERGFIAMEYMRNIVFPKIQSITLSDIREYYDKHAAEFQDAERVKWQMIFIDASKFADRDSARRYAEQTLQRLRAGQDFAAVAKQLRDAGLNTQLGDDGIGEKPGDIRPTEVETTLLRLRAGEVGGPVEMPGGYNLLRVTERKYAGRKPFTPEIQTAIRQKLQGKVFEKEYRRLVEEMKAKVVIQRVGTP